MAKHHKQKASRRRRLFRRKTTMEVLDCSLNMVKRLEQAGKLRKIRLGTRDVFHDAEQVESLASLAPMLAPVVLPPDFLAYGQRIWTIVSGEQKPGKRPMDPAWARSLLAQCASADVPFFLLQMARKRKIPTDLNVREFPRPQC